MTGDRRIEPSRPIAGRPPTVGELARAAREPEQGRITVPLSRPGFEIALSLPCRPRAILLAGGDSDRARLLEVAGTELAIATVSAHAGEPSSTALAEAAGWLRRQPETRGLPLVAAGIGADRELALAAARAADALLIDGERRPGEPVVLAPTVIASPGRRGEAVRAELLAQLGLDSSCGSIGRARRRRLARAIERRLRAERRRHGGLGREARATLAALAATLAFTLSLGLGAPPRADAAVTVTFASLTGQLSVVSDAAADDVTLACSVDGAGSYNDFTYDTGGGPTTLPGTAPTIDGQLECGAISSITVTGAGGADSLDLGSVNDSAGNFEFLGPNDVTVDGGAAGDEITAPQSIDGNRLLGQGGNDTLDGGSGTDLMIGGSGNDSMPGGGGSDTLDYGAATGPLSGALDGTVTGDGTDTVTAENAIATAAGDSLTAAAALVTSISGGSGNDTLTGAAGVATMVGGAGTDVLTGGSAADSLAGDSDSDTLTGGSGTITDTLSGGTEADSLNGGDGADSIAAGDGDDTIQTGDTANDTLNGEAGAGDLVDYATATGPVTINLSTDSATGSGTDTLTLIEHATGSPVADSINGDSAVNTLSGGAGGDTIFASAGADSVVGSGGADSLDGSNNIDTLSGGTEADTLSTGTGDVGFGESVDGGDGADSLTATSSTFASLLGGPGIDTLVGSSGGDSADGGSEADSLEGNDGADTMLGVAGIDSLFGENGGDSLVGGSEADLVDGANDADTLDGDLGNADTVRGGTGADSLLGGLGSGDLLRQSASASTTLTNTQITGDGPDTLSGFEAAEVTVSAASALLDASGFTGAGGTTLMATDATDTVAGSQGSDSIQGTSGALLRQTSGSAQVLSNTQLTGLGTDTLAGFTKVSLTGDGAGNSIDATAFTAAVTLDGTGGDDTLAPGSPAVADSVVGGSGADRLVVSQDQGLDLSDGALVAEFGGTDTLSGIDQASLSGGAGSTELDATPFSGTVTLDGLAGSDTLIGTAQSDLLADSGASGVDVIEQVSDAATQTLTNTQLTGRGTDTIAGIQTVGFTGAGGSSRFDASAFTAGSVNIEAGDGNDTLLGGSVSDLLHGGPGTDRVEQTLDANQTLDNDSLISGANQDDLDQIEQVSLTGGPSANTIQAFLASSFVVTIAGLGGADTLSGGLGSDSIAGGTEGDSLWGSQLDDTLSGESGNDTLDGGDGAADRIVEAFDSAITLMPSTLTGGGGTDHLLNLERAALTGGAAGNAIDASAWLAGPVTLNGLGGDDTITGGAAGDSLQGSDQNDQLRGGLGADTLDGGIGVNLADFSDDPGGAGIDADLEAGNSAGESTDSLVSIQSILGTSLGDTLTGDDAANTLTGGGGPDSLTGSDGADQLAGLAGDDTIDAWDGATTDDVNCGADTDFAMLDIGEASVECETSELPDVDPPGVTLGGSKKQKSAKQAIVKVTCDEHCDVVATGTIKIPKVNSKGKFVKYRKYDLKKVERTFNADVTKEIKMKLKSGGLDALKKARRKGSSKKAREAIATIKVTGTDDSGNESSIKSRKVTLRK